MGKVLGKFFYKKNAETFKDVPQTFWQLSYPDIDVNSKINIKPSLLLMLPVLEVLHKRIMNNQYSQIIYTEIKVQKYQHFHVTNLNVKRIKQKQRQNNLYQNLMLIFQCLKKYQQMVIKLIQFLNILDLTVQN